MVLLMWLLTWSRDIYMHSDNYSKLWQKATGPSFGYPVSEGTDGKRTTFAIRDTLLISYFHIPQYRMSESRVVLRSNLCSWLASCMHAGAFR